MLALVVVLALQASSGADLTPPTDPPTPAVWQRIEASQSSRCPDSEKLLARALKIDNIGNRAQYVHSLIRCGARQSGITQARIYGAAIADIEGSILFMKPDADEAAAWRKTARTLITKGRPNAKSDPELVDLYNTWEDKLP